MRRLRTRLARRRQARATLAELTALRRERPGRVVLEVDGRPWRTVSDDVVVRTGLAAGMQLERPLLRRLRSELRRTAALSIAGRALARRDLSRARLAAQLERRGFARDLTQDVVEHLAVVGAVDDARVASGRARELSARGWGNAAIQARLEQEGIDAELARAAVHQLPSEAERARPLAARGADARRVARMLITRGFSAEVVEDVVGALDAEA